MKLLVLLIYVARIRYVSVSSLHLYLSLTEGMSSYLALLPPQSVGLFHCVLYLYYADVRLNYCRTSYPWLRTFWRSLSNLAHLFWCALSARGVFILRPWHWSWGYGRSCYVAWLVLRVCIWSMWAYCSYLTSMAPNGAFIHLCSSYVHTWKLALTLTSKLSLFVSRSSFTQECTIGYFFDPAADPRHVAALLAHA